MGDRLGGDGWYVKLPDGSPETYYVKPPDGVQGVVTSVHFEDAPTEHQGEVISETSMDALAERYIAYLRGLVAEAKERFSP